MKELIKGKWYKNYSNPSHYMRCNGFDNKYLLGDEYIGGFKDYQKSKNSQFSWCLDGIN